VGGCIDTLAMYYHKPPRRVVKTTTHTGWREETSLRIREESMERGLIYVNFTLHEDTDRAT